MNAPANLGHNRPNVEDQVRDRLAADYEATIHRVGDLLAQATILPASVSDDDESGRVSDFVKSVADEIKKIEAFREAEKAPHLQAGRAVDGFFKALNEKLDRLKRQLETSVGIYLRAKAAEERRRREEAERIAREEAARKLREAEAAADRAAQEANTKIEEAFAAEAEATKAAQAAAAKPAELARTRSVESGSLATLKQEWVFEVENYDAIPLDVIRPFIPLPAFDQAIRAFVKAGHRSLPGVRIYEIEKAVIR